MRLDPAVVAAPMHGLTGKTIAVTGASGFIGGALVKRLTRLDCTIIRVSRAEPPGLMGSGPASITDVRGDVADRAVWDRLGHADVIFHCAAQTSAAVAAQDPSQDFRNNVVPMQQLLGRCRERARRPIVVFAGTVTQVGIAARIPVNEDAADQPVTIYDRHKLMAEDELKSAAAAGFVRGVSLRLPNVYGPGAHVRSGDRDVMNRMIRAAMRGETLTVYGAGDYLRDYVFIDDAVLAFLMAAGCPDEVNGRHFVIATGQGHTIAEAFRKITARVEAKCGRRVAVASEPGWPLTAIEQRQFVGDASRFTAATGWSPSCSLEQGIDRTIEAYQCES